VVATAAGFIWRSALLCGGKAESPHPKCLFQQPSSLETAAASSLAFGWRRNGVAAKALAAAWRGLCCIESCGGQPSGGWLAGVKAAFISYRPLAKYSWQPANLAAAMKMALRLIWRNGPAAASIAASAAEAKTAAGSSWRENENMA
jgi:hypothetical protein